jgi:hypothetical protein
MRPVQGWVLDEQPGQAVPAVAAALRALPARRLEMPLRLAAVAKLGGFREGSAVQPF